MNTSLCESQEIRILARTHSTELVRGDEKELLERVAPLVHQQSVQLDLGNIDRIDAAGISALVALYTRANRAGHAFSVCNASARVIEILKLVGLEPILVSHNAIRTSHDEPCLERSAA